MQTLVEQSGKGSGSVGIRDEAGSSSLADDSAGHVRNAKAASKLDGDGAAAGGTGSSGMSSGGRLLRELKLEVPIRYSAGDEIESWLHRLLCLDATDKTPALKHGCPHPSECDLYYVERDTLFSHHKAAEDFLQGMMSLYVSSHYKNSPNDLQLLSDAPVCMSLGCDVYLSVFQRAPIQAWMDASRKGPSCHAVLACTRHRARVLPQRCGCASHRIVYRRISFLFCWGRWMRHQRRRPTSSASCKSAWRARFPRSLCCPNSAGGTGRRATSFPGRLRSNFRMLTSPGCRVRAWCA